MEDFEKRQMMKDVGARVYALRTAANMSRETLAERLNITPQYVSEIEQGKKCMNMSIFAELGRVFHRGLDDLAWGEAPADPRPGRAGAAPAGALPGRPGYGHPYSAPDLSLHPGAGAGAIMRPRSCGY